MKKLIHTYKNFRNAPVWHNPSVVHGGGIVIVVAVLVALYSVLKHKDTQSQKGKEKKSKG
jgi:hypothetical protein